MTIAERHERQRQLQARADRLAELLANPARHGADAAGLTVDRVPVPRLHPGARGRRLDRRRGRSTPGTRPAAARNRVGAAGGLRGPHRGPGWIIDRAGWTGVICRNDEVISGVWGKVRVLR